MLTKPKVKIVGYNPALLELLCEYESHYLPHPEDANEKAFLANNTEVAYNIYKTAIRWKNTPVKSGVLIPGIGADCIGLVLGILIDAGVLRMPARFINAYSVREKEIGNVEASVLNFRLQAFLCYVLLNCVNIPGVIACPVTNPKDIIPGDILSSVYTLVINDFVLLPHVSLVIAPNKIFTANFGSEENTIVDCEANVGFVKLVENIDSELKFPVTNSRGEPLSGMAFRLIKHEKDSYYYRFKKRFFKLFRYILKEIKKKT